jgi:hypothetical protein
MTILVRPPATRKHKRAPATRQTRSPRHCRARLRAPDGGPSRQSRHLKLRLLPKDDRNDPRSRFRAPSASTGNGALRGHGAWQLDKVVRPASLEIRTGLECRCSVCLSGRLVRAGSIAIGPGPLKSLQLNAQIFQGLLKRRQPIVGDRHSGRAQPVPQPGARGGMLQQAIQELGRR